MTPPTVIIDGGKDVYDAAAMEKSVASMTATSVTKLEVVIASALVADEPAIVSRLVSIINGAYKYELGVFWDPNSWQRTNPDEIGQTIRDGGLAIAWRGDSAQKEAEDVLGCCYVKMVSPTTTDFGMLATDETHRGLGVGRELVKFSESWAKQQGAQLMQLELLYPDGWENERKEGLARWYERAGYRLIRVDDIRSILGHMAHQLIQPTVLRIYHKTLL